MIKFNYAPYNGTISPRWLKEGTPTEIISVAEIDLSVLANLSKENRPWI